MVMVLTEAGLYNFISLLNVLRIFCALYIAVCATALFLVETGHLGLV